MDTVLIALVGIVALALAFDFTNGFHDAANSVSTVVATRAMPAKWAVWFSAFFNFVAYFAVSYGLFGWSEKVANTVAKVVNPDASGLAVIFAALMAAILWNYATWWVGMPSSSSHALIGGLVGAGLSAGGIDAIAWESVRKVGIAIIASPLVAFTIAFLAMFLVAGVQKLFTLPDNARGFKWLQLASAALVSLGHGANDAMKTMGVIAAALIATGHLTVPESGEIVVPQWVALSAYTAIAVGTVWGGWKIIETMGLRITTLHASSGVAANIGAVTAIFGATNYGIPISTTHAAASSVTGAGVASGRGINLKVVGEMVASWIVTLPATATVAFLIYQMTQLPTAAAWLAVGSLLFVSGGAILYAMTHTVHADDVEAEIPPEEALAVHVPPVPHIEGEGPVA